MFHPQLKYDGCNLDIHNCLSSQGIRNMLTRFIAFSSCSPYRKILCNSGVPLRLVLWTRMVIRMIIRWHSWTGSASWLCCGSFSDIASRLRHSHPVSPRLTRLVLGFVLFSALEKIDLVFETWRSTDYFKSCQQDHTTWCFTLEKSHFRWNLSADITLYLVRKYIYKILNKLNFTRKIHIGVQMRVIERLFQPWGWAGAGWDNKR